MCFVKFSYSCRYDRLTWMIQLERTKIQQDSQHASFFDLVFLHALLWDCVTLVLSLVMLLASQMSDFLHRTQENSKMQFIFQVMHCAHMIHAACFFSTTAFDCSCSAQLSRCVCVCVDGVWMLRTDVISIWQSISRQCARMHLNMWSLANDMSWGCWIC